MRTYGAAYDIDRDDEAVCWPNPSGDAGIAYPLEDYAQLPGYVVYGLSTTTADEYHGDWSQGQPDKMSQELFSGELSPNPEVGGVSAMAMRSPFSLAGVESTTVENFELTGQVLKNRRPAETGEGPVGFTDYSGFLAQALAQDYYYTPYDDNMQADILTAV